jgi:FkbM family methyltransferase
MDVTMRPAVPKPGGNRLDTARRLFASRGLAGLAAVMSNKAQDAWRSARRWWYRDHEWLGRLVELRGNRVRLEGCTFDVSHPQITRALRARMLRGRYERSERELMKAWLDPAAPVIELGGGIGVVSTLVNRQLRDAARHVVVEANPSLIPVIERQKQANGTGYTVVNAAIDYSPGGMTELHIGDEFISARVGGGTPSGTVRVPSMTLAGLLERYPWTGATLLCDIEGIETELVEREGEHIGRHFRTLIIEVHPEFRSAAQCEALFTRLDALGFEKTASVRKVHAFRKRDPR